MNWPRLCMATVWMLTAAVGGGFAAAAEQANGREIRLDAEAVIPVFEPDDRLAWIATYENAGDILQDGRFLWQVSGWDGVVAQGERPVNLPKGSNVLRVAFDRPGLGWFELTTQIRDARGQVIATGTQTFSIAEPHPIVARPFRYGVATLAPRLSGDELVREMALIEPLGVDIMRSDVSWGRVEPTDDVWAFDRLDTVFDAMADAGIEVQGILAYTTRWASTGDPNAKDWLDWARVMPRMDAFLDYVDTAVRHYDGRIRYWEIWNEPDISFWRGTTAEFAELFNAASARIAEVAPEVQVLNGGFAMVRRQPNPDFIDDFIGLADQANWDIWVYHDYHTFPQMLSRFREHEAYYRQAGASMPVWVNEGGFHTLLPGGEREQALTLVKKLATAPALGIEAYFWHNLRDNGPDPNDKEHHFGLVRYSFDPKPSYSAYQRLIRELAPRRYTAPSGERPLPEGTWAHVYAADAGAGDDHVVVLWHEADERRVPTWVGWPDAEVTSIIDLMGNAVPWAAANGGAMLNLSREPLYVRFRGRASTPAVKPVLTGPDQVTVLPNAESPVEITLHNPSNSPLRCRVVFETDDPQVRARSDAQRALVAPGESAAVRSTLILTGAPASPTGRLTVRVVPDGGEASIAAVFPFEVATALPRAPSVVAPEARLSPERAWSVVLDRREDVTNLYSAEPAPQMQWRGRDDLSATAYLAHDERGLCIDVIVRDDIHHQPSPDRDLWQGDSLQLGVWLGQNPMDYLELGLTLTDGGELAWVYQAPSAGSLKVGELSVAAPVHVERDGVKTRYSVRLPWAALASPTPPHSLRLNFIVNDNDTQGRKQWVQLTEGIGGHKDPRQFRLFQVQP